MLSIALAGGCVHPAAEPSGLRLKADNGRILLFSTLPVADIPPEARTGKDGTIVVLPAGWEETDYSRRAAAR